MNGGIVCCAFTALLLLTGCGDDATSSGAAHRKVVTVYSPHGKLKPETGARFEAAHSGWKVEFLDLGGGEILTRLQEEKRRPAADVWWGGAPGDFDRAAKLGLLEPYAPDWTKNLPPEAKAADGSWVATFRTPEVILFNPLKVKREDVPNTWDDLLDERWRGRIVIRDVRPSATMKTILGALILREKKRTGKIDDGFAFLKKLDANTGSYAANPNVLYEMMEREGPLAVTVWNLPDAQQLVAEKRSFEYVIPAPTPVPVEPVAIIKGAPNLEGARLFHDFVNSPQELITLATERFRIPARTDLPTDKLPQWMRDLKLEAMPIDWSELQKNSEEWMARWDSEIKGKFIAR